VVRFYTLPSHSPQPGDFDVMPEKMRNHFCWLIVCLKKTFNLGHPGTITMKQAIAICAAIGLISVYPLFADFGVVNRGTWPDDWPKELEKLRERSRTLEGPKQPSLNYAISFKTRDEFEAAWPYLLKVKTKGAPIVLRRGPSFWFENEKNAGVCVHTPPKGQVPIADGKDAKGNWEATKYIELIVDGEIVDLNRILLPPDTPIIDERFKEGITKR
jgi:hypothetical protein